MSSNYKSNATQHNEFDPMHMFAVHLFTCIYCMGNTPFCAHSTTEQATLDQALNLALPLYLCAQRLWNISAVFEIAISITCYTVRRAQQFQHQKCNAGTALTIVGYRANVSNKWRHIIPNRTKVLNRSDVRIYSELRQLKHPAGSRRLMTLLWSKKNNKNVADKYWSKLFSHGVGNTASFLLLIPY